MATCPECEYDELDTEDYEEGDNLSCPECGTGLVVAGTGELEVAVEDLDVVDDKIDDAVDEEALVEDVVADEEEYEE